MTRRVLRQPYSRPGGVDNFARTMEERFDLLSLRDEFAPGLDLDSYVRAHPDGKAFMWALTRNNAARWRDLSVGDLVVFHGLGRTYAVGCVASKVHWPNNNLVWDEGTDWDYIYTFSKVVLLPPPSGPDWSAFTSVFRPGGAAQQTTFLPGVDLDDVETAARFSGLFESGSLDQLELGANVPAEFAEDTLDQLRRLLGETLTLGSGRDVKLLSLDAGHLAFGRVGSPPIVRIPVPTFSAALQDLRSTGRLPTLDSDAGILLRQMLLLIPGVTDSSADRARPDEIDDESIPDALGYGAVLERPYTGAARREQNMLRKLLIGGHLERPCGICGTVYPVQFLWAAHIKKRSVCSPGEKNDPNIAMLACVFGCDVLYEAGYISVDERGLVIGHGAGPQAVAQKVASLSGRQVFSFPRSKPFFDWHRANIFRGVL